MQKTPLGKLLALFVTITLQLQTTPNTQAQDHALLIGHGTCGGTRPVADAKLQVIDLQTYSVIRCQRLPFLEEVTHIVYNDLSGYGRHIYLFAKRGKIYEFHPNDLRVDDVQVPILVPRQIIDTGAMGARYPVNIAVSKDKSIFAFAKSSLGKLTFVLPHNGGQVIESSIGFSHINPETNYGAAIAFRSNDRSVVTAFQLDSQVPLVSGNVAYAQGTLTAHNGQPLVRHDWMKGMSYYPLVQFRPPVGLVVTRSVENTVPQDRVIAITQSSFPVPARWVYQMDLDTNNRDDYFLPHSYGFQGLTAIAKVGADYGNGNVDHAIMAGMNGGQLYEPNSRVFVPINITPGFAPQSLKSIQNRFWTITNSQGVGRMTMAHGAQFFAETKAHHVIGQHVTDPNQIVFLGEAPANGGVLAVYHLKCQGARCTQINNTIVSGVTGRTGSWANPAHLIAF